MQRFTDHVVVIAGAAGQIGSAVAARFADEGAVVVGVDRREHEVGQVRLVADLRDEDAVRSLYRQVAHEHGRLDVVYNNVGLMDGADHAADDTDLSAWRRVQDANLTTTFLSCKHAIPHLGGGVGAGRRHRQRG